MDRAMSGALQNIAVDGVDYQCSFCPWEFEFVWKYGSALLSALSLQCLCKIGVSCFSEVKQTSVC